jgi:hypothetical protein
MNYVTTLRHLIAFEFCSYGRGSADFAFQFVTVRDYKEKKYNNIITCFFCFNKVL